MPKTSLILCVILTCTSFLSEARAQSKSVGTSFSYAGIGAVYEHTTGKDSFAEIQLRTETAGIFGGTMFYPGISASFTWNMIFAEAQSRNGNRIIFFAGPGATAGFTGDMKSSWGLMAGLKGRVGGECTFRRNVSISVSISPIIGVHTSRRGTTINMLIYKTGLLHAIMPEIGIKYAF